MQKPSNYSFSADLIRALAIILVVLIHVFSEFLNYPKVLGSIDWWVADIINAGARIAVPLFIMLSGMLLLHTEKNYTLTDFFKKRVSKIGIPIIIWPIIYLTWNVWLHHTSYTIISLIKDYINLNIYYHLYYLYIIVALYLLTPIIKIVINHASKEIKNYLMALSLALSLALTSSIYFFQIDINLSTIYTVFIPYFGYYIAGDFFRNKKITKKQFYLYAISFIVLMVITALGTRAHMNSVHLRQMGVKAIDYGKYFYDYASITVAGMSVIAFILLHNIPGKITPLKESKIAGSIVSLAGASFGIYLIHPLLLEFSNRILNISFETLPLPLFVFLCIKLTVIFLAAYLLVWTIKKIPLLRLIV
ncbi:acyltransferase family protein [soil metagenome]